MVRDSTSWVIAGTKTFRLGSRKILRTFGGNLQNIEKDLRAVYIPDEGKGFVQTDQAGAEALIVAYDCTLGDYRKLFINGIKPHVYTAMKLFKDKWSIKMRALGTLENFSIEPIYNSKIEDLKETLYWKELDSLIKSSDNWLPSERYYFLAKKIVHAYNNGLNSPDALRMYILEGSDGQVNISKEDGVNFLFNYKALFPELDERARRVHRQVEQTRVIYNFFGEPYFVTDYDISPKILRDCQTWPQQSTVGEITNRAFTSLQNFIEKEKLDWDALINGHDSILSQAPLAELKDLAKVQSGFLEPEFESPVDGTRFKMRSETQIGLNWAPFKKDKNPMGLKEIKL